MKEFRNIMAILLVFVFTFLPTGSFVFANEDLSGTYDGEFMVSKDLQTDEVTAQDMDTSAIDIPLPISALEQGLSTPLSNSFRSSSSNSGIQPRDIVNGDNRQQITNTQQVPYSPICQIAVTFPNGSTYKGTGFLTKSNIVITAGHVLYDPGFGGWAKSVIVYPGKNGSNHPYGSFKSVKATVGGTWYSSLNPDGDFGVIKLDRDAYAGTLPLSVLSDSEFIQLQVTVTGYPGEKASGTMWSGSGAILTKTKYQITHSCDSTGGTSGAPIYDANNKVVGIHTLGDGFNGGVRIIQDFVSWLATF